MKIVVIILATAAAWPLAGLAQSPRNANSDRFAAVAAIDSGKYDPEGCVLVREVEPESPAWQAGVREGMFISHVGGRRVTTPEEFRAASRGIGDKLDIRLTQPSAQTDEDAGPQ